MAITVSRDHEITTVFVTLCRKPLLDAFVKRVEIFAMRRTAKIKQA